MEWTRNAREEMGAELQEKKDSIDIEVLLAVMNQIEYLEETCDLEARE